MKRKKPIRRASKKHKAELEKYYRLREVFLRENPWCQCGRICVENNASPFEATQIHHKMRRGKYLNDISIWMAVCGSCHDWIETNANSAREAGWLLT